MQLAAARDQELVGVFQLLDRQPAIELGKGRKLDVSAIDRRGGHIRFDNVHFRYPTRPETPILNGVSLDIQPGSSVALVGGSGAGKSSVHALLLRFYEPTAGVVSFDGQDVRDVEPESLRSFMGVVSQEPTLFEGTIAENIAYGTPGATQQQIERAAKQAHCVEFIEALPRGYDTPIGPRELSGGQRQRIAIARALMLKPTLLVLDEPVSALDLSVQAQVLNLLADLQDEFNLAYVFISHDLSVVRYIADDVLVMNKGEAVEQGTREAVFANPTHPYTRELFAATAVTDIEAIRQRVARRQALRAASA